MLVGFFSANFVLAALTALNSVMISRFLGVRARGDFAEITAIINLVVTISALGVPTYVSILLAKERSNKVLLRDLQIKALHVGLTSGILGTLVFFCYWLFQFHSKMNATGLVLIQANIVISSISTILLGIGIGAANFRAFNFGRISFFPVFICLCSVSAYFSFYSANLLVVFLIISNLFAVFVQCIMCGIYLPLRWIDIKAVVDFYLKSKSFAVNSVVNALSANSDVLAISLLTNSESLGLWAAARTIAGVAGPINSALSTSVFANTIDEGTGAHDAYFFKYIGIFLAINLSFLLCVIALSGIIIELIFGDRFAAAGDLLPWAMTGIVAGNFADMFEERLRGRARANRVSVTRGIPVVGIAGFGFLFQIYATLPALAMVFCGCHVFRALAASCLYHFSNE